MVIGVKGLTFWTPSLRISVRTSRNRSSNTKYRNLGVDGLKLLMRKSIEYVTVSIRRLWRCHPLFGVNTI